LDNTLGRLLLALAVAMHRTVAGGPARERWQLRRNAALRAANRRGVPVAELAARLGLSEGWVRQVLNGKRPPVIEEAA
jgi:transcriptional regulator with XRE-family HTH domain